MDPCLHSSLFEYPPVKSITPPATSVTPPAHGSPLTSSPHRFPQGGSHAQSAELSKTSPGGHSTQGVVGSKSSSWWPSGHFVQASSSAKDPTGQTHSSEASLETRSAGQSEHSSAPTNANVPARHSVQGVAANRSASAYPAAQGSHSTAPSAAYVPTGQTTHSVAFAAADAVPAGQR